MVKGFEATVYLQQSNGLVERASPDTGLFYQPSISPQGDQVVFFGGVSGFPRLWSHRPGSKPGLIEPLTPTDSGARHPCFDWDGRRLAFASDRAFPESGETVEQISSATRHVSAGIQMNIYISQPDGSDPQQLTSGPFVDHRPTWSPDGRWIAFASNRSGRTGICRVPADGSSDPVPVHLPTWGYRPWYLPSGGSILFYGPDHHRHRIWMVHLDSGVVEPLRADDQGTTHGPFINAARPDTVLAHSTRGGGWGIWEFPIRPTERSPSCVTPEGFTRASHPSRSNNDLMAFDVKRSDGSFQRSSSSNPSSA